MRRQTGPVQQWIDSIPSPIKSNFSMKNENQGESSKIPNISLASTEPKDIPYSMRTKELTMTMSAPINVPNTTNNTIGPTLPRYIEKRYIISLYIKCIIYNYIFLYFIQFIAP